MYLDSIGDRVFICGPQVARRLFDGERVMQAVLADQVHLLPIYQWFLVPHRFPQALLYEFGSRIVPIRNDVMSVTIYRGRLSEDDLRPAWLDDARQSPSQAARDLLNAGIPQ